MIKEIIQLGNPVLRIKAEPVEDVSALSIKQIIEDLHDTLKDSGGVGIAAPQIGESLQVILIASKTTPREGEPTELRFDTMINPELLESSEEKVKDWEGCLSIPGIRALVSRHSSIKIRFTQADTGEIITTNCEGLTARIFQHEFDHLNSTVYIDRIETTKDIVTDQEYKKIIFQKKQTPEEDNEC